jgi:hypothetical protein
MRATARTLTLVVTLLPSTLSAQGKPVDLVRKLYAQYAWETRDSEVGSRLPFFSDSAGVLRQYLDAPLVNAILADRACEVREEGECNLGFEPMWDSQDPGGVTFTILSTADPTVVQARIHYPYHNETHVLTYRLRQTRAGWRIVDISSPRWRSLLALLRRPVK